MRIIGVTGTDTGVGKTRITAAIALALRAAGRTVAALKPVASGVPRGTIADDAAEIAAAAGHEPRVLAAFEAPISPHRAAAMEGVAVPREAVRDWIRRFRAEIVLVEGAGGLRSPLGEDEDGWYFLDDLGCSALVAVAANRLGVLNQAGLLLATARAPVLGLVLNDGVGDAADPSRQWNASDLRRLTDVITVPSGDAATLAAALAGWVDRL